MADEYLWDSRAAQKVEEQELDKHFKSKRRHYFKLAEEAWRNLKGINEQPEYLKHGDLYDVLFPVVYRDATTIQAFAARNLPAPLERAWKQWYAWFTHYIVENYLKSLEVSR